MAFNTDPVRYSALARPNALAVVDLATGRRLSYAELDAAVTRSAERITDAMSGAPRGERHAYLGRNGIEFLLAALGAERCGAVFVPLNWRLAAPEIGALLVDCRPKLVDAAAEFRDLTGGYDPDDVRTPAPPLPLAPDDPDRPIILLYTSGTTGSPKSAIVSAQNAFAAALNFIAVGEVGPDSVLLSDLPMFHTIGLIAVARSTLMAGGTLVLSDRFLPARTLAALADPALGITHYFGVPMMAEALAREPDFFPETLARLKAIFLGGAPLAPALIERFLAFGVPLVNGYGMSEAGTAIHVPLDRDMIRRSAGAVGLPAPHMAVRLVADGRDVPDGAVGEIWLRGPSVTPGYWNRPAETAAAFEDGWFRTGDLARREPNGFYRIVDRLKDMYVSGGENVYPAEVEAALTLHPDVADAAVLGIPDDRWGETGLAFVVLHSGGKAGTDGLLAHCRNHLARYKCPSRVVVLDALPRSAAGKLLKPALRQRFNIGEFS